MDPLPTGVAAMRAPGGEADRLAQFFEVKPID